MKNPKNTKIYVFKMSVASWCCKSFCVVPCVSFCTGHFVMMPLNMTYLHCLQHSLFKHLFNLYCNQFIYQEYTSFQTSFNVFICSPNPRRKPLHVRSHIHREPVLLSSRPYKVYPVWSRWQRVRAVVSFRSRLEPALQDVLPNFIWRSIYVADN